MLGNFRIKKRAYYLFAVRKHNVMHCAAYSTNGMIETITSIETGEIFHSLYDFVFSILGMNTRNEFDDCVYYSEFRNRWRPIKYIIVKSKTKKEFH
jgi:hypothetical protein